MGGTVHIEKIITGGYGLGRRQDGMVVLTRFVLPGETIRFRQIRKRRGHIEAETVEVLDRSPDRVTAALPVLYGMRRVRLPAHLPDAQLRIKEKIIDESLLRAGIRFSPSRLRPILPSPATWHYRRRLRLKLSPAGAIGFFKPASNELAAVDRCPVATAPLNRALLELSRFPLLSGLGGVGSGDSISCTARRRPGLCPAPSPAWQNHHRIPGVRTRRLPALRRQHRHPAPGTTGGRDLLRQDFASDLAGRPFSLTWTPACFSQVNAEQNGRLIKLVLSLAGPPAGKRLLDLFCGMGNFSVPLAIAGAQVTGVEWNRESIPGRESTRQRRESPQTVFVASDVLSAVRRFLHQRQRSTSSFSILPVRVSGGKAPCWRTWPRKK
jgi:23S rRNA (uracil1939-C5)-methyltransferase